jgi:hypothetical protein
LDDGYPVTFFNKGMEMFEGDHVGMAATDKHEMFAHFFSPIHLNQDKDLKHLIYKKNCLISGHT